MKMKAASQTQRVFSAILILLCTLGHAGRGREVGGAPWVDTHCFCGKTTLVRYKHQPLGATVCSVSQRTNK